MKQSGGEKILNPGSMTSYFEAGYASPYTTSKGDIVQFIKSLAMAWAQDNIEIARVTRVQSGQGRDNGRVRHAL